MDDIIQFSGTNEKLFTRVVVEKVTAKTSLVVPETHNAILIKDGEMLQTLQKGKYTLCKLVEVKKDEPLLLDIMFVSKTAKLKLLWGTPNKVQIADPVLMQTYKIGMSGDFEVQVGDPRKCFLYLVGADGTLTADALQERLMSKVVATVEDALATYIAQNAVTYSKIYLCKKEIADIVTSKLTTAFTSSYGIVVCSFNIANIIIDEADLERLNGGHKEEEKLVCSSCGKELPLGSKFCNFCGKKVENGRLCPKCHAENSGDALFCAVCGSKLDS